MQYRICDPSEFPVDEDAHTKIDEKEYESEDDKCQVIYQYEISEIRAEERCVLLPIRQFDQLPRVKFHFSRVILLPLYASHFFMRDHAGRMFPDHIIVLIKYDQIFQRFKRAQEHCHFTIKFIRGILIGNIISFHDIGEGIFKDRKIEIFQYAWNDDLI